MRLSFINGILAIIFGIIALLIPDITIAALSIYLAIALIVGGIVLIIGTRDRRDAIIKWHVFLIEGIIGILVGILILIRPISAATFFTVIIGIWALVIGAILMFMYIQNRKHKINSFTHLIGGILSLAFGFLIIINPFESLRIIIVLIGLYAIVYGIISLINTSKMYLK